MEAPKEIDRSLEAIRTWMYRYLSGNTYSFLNQLLAIVAAYSRCDRRSMACISWTADKLLACRRGSGSS